MSDLILVYRLCRNSIEDSINRGFTWDKFCAYLNDFPSTFAGNFTPTGARTICLVKHIHLGSYPNTPIFPKFIKFCDVYQGNEVRVLWFCAKVQNNKPVFTKLGGIVFYISATGYTTIASKIVDAIDNHRSNY